MRDIVGIYVATIRDTDQVVDAVLVEIRVHDRHSATRCGSRRPLLGVHREIERREIVGVQSGRSNQHCIGARAEHIADVESIVMRPVGIHFG